MAPIASLQRLASNFRNSPEIKPQDLEADVGKCQSSVTKASLRESLWTLVKIWKWELFSWCLSALALVLLVVALCGFDGQSPSMLPILKPTGSTGLTLNTVVAILANTIRAALIYPVAESISQLKWVWFNDHRRRLQDFESYDMASRGPWGSFRMLFSPALWHFVSLGLIITITSIAVGPSIQQILTYPLVVSPWYASGNQALLPRADYYAAFQNTLGHSSMFSTLKSDLKGAVYSGIFESTNISTPAPTTIQPTCTTGNCTWQSYSSLAVCSKCQNISSLLINDLSQAGKSFTGQSYSPYWTHPSGYRTDGKYAMNITTNASSIVYLNLQNPIINLKSAVFDPNSGGYNNVNRPNVTECALWFCVNTYEAKMRNGTFTEEVIRSWPAPEDTRNMTQNTTLPPVEPDGRSSLKQYEPNATVDSLQPSYLKVPYEVDMKTLQLLRNWIGGLFQKDKDADMSRDAGEGEKYDLAQVLYDIQQGTSTGMTNMFQSIATKMTDVVRKQQGVAGQYTANVTRLPGVLTPQANGTADSMVVSVRVEWIWLSFPIVLVFASFLFLVATVLITSSKEIPSWKSSNLAVLAMGLDEGNRRDFTRDGTSLPTLDRKAKDFEVHLGRRDEEMRLGSHDKQIM